MTTLYFTKLFNKGHLLAGLTYHGQLSFPDVDHAMRWLKAVSEPRLAKRNGWQIVDRSFQKYAR